MRVSYAAHWVEVGARMYRSRRWPWAFMGIRPVMLSLGRSWAKKGSWGGDLVFLPRDTALGVYGLGVRVRLGRDATSGGVEAGVLG